MTLNQGAWPLLRSLVKHPKKNEKNSKYDQPILKLHVEGSDNEFPFFVEMLRRSNFFDILINF